MRNIIENTFGKVKVIQNSNYQWGVFTIEGNEIVPFGKYAWIDSFNQGLARVRSHGKLRHSKNIVCIFLDNDKLIENNKDIEELLKSDIEKNPEKYSKWGIINEKGEEVLPVEYDSVWNFYGKNRRSTKTIKKHFEKEVYFNDLISYSKQNVTESSDYNEPAWDDYGSHYGDFAGTYAQDIAGYSDDAIYDAFDGDPDAYWNID